PEPPTYAVIGDAVMEVLAAYCMLEVGSLYVVGKDGALAAKVATLGRVSDIDRKDPLLERALRKGQLTYVPAASNPDRDPQLAKSPLLAVVPFVNSAGVTNAILCVQAMPFIAFERKNLEAMATLAGHFADLVTFGGESSSIERGRKELFQVRLTRSLRDQKEREIPSVIAALWIKRAAPVSELVDVLLGGALRELEFPYVARDRNENYLVYVLLPMADETAARALEQRFEAIVRNKLNMTLAASGALFFWRLLAPTDTVAGIFRIFEEKAYADGQTLGSGGRLR
ncbi:MAG TPA: PelD GGDEF domain-containing protein, partial [Labilithrix sp.]